MKRIFTCHLKISLVFVTLFSYLGTAYPQHMHGEIKGIVKTNDLKPAADVNILLKEAGQSTFTDEKGRFSFKKIKGGAYTLTISFVGKQSQQKTVKLSDGQTVEEEFILAQSSETLAEVVITAWNSVNKKPIAAGKIQAAPLDLPQSMSVVNGAIIEQQQSQRLSDVVKNVNGVYLATTRGSTQETFYARGYNFGANNMFKNGSRVNTGAMPEVSSLERVEVLKGSAAILYGNVAPGGILNMVTKKPKFQHGAEISLRAGSYDLYKPSIDVYGPINENIAYRVNGTYETANSYRSNVSSERYYFNPSFLFKLGEKTELTVQGDYLNHDFTPDFGTGAIDNRIADVGRSSYFGTPWATGNTKQTTASANVIHKINPIWSLDFTGAYQNYKREFQSVERIQPKSDGDWTRPLGKSNTSEDYLSGQFNLSGKFTTGVLTHTLLTGVDADRYLNTNYVYTEANQYLDGSFNLVSNAYDVINLLDPNKYTPRTDFPTMNALKVTETPTIRYGIYANDLITISPKFNALLGLRWSYQKAYSAKTTNLRTDAVTRGAAKDDQAFSPRVGLVYKPLPTTSVFASYTNSFSVNTGLDINGDALKPSIIDQYEVGVKNDLFKGLLSANLSLYSIVNHNLAQTALFRADGTENTDPNIKELAGQTKSKGFEIDLSGHPLAGLDIIAGYSFNDMRYTKTPDRPGNFKEGQRVVNSPAHTANASVFYTLKNTNLRGLKLGATANYVGERWGGWNNTFGQTQDNRLILVSDFTTVDISAGYSFKKFSLLAKVSNLGNTLNYYVHENYSINPIPPRQFATTVTYKF